MAERELVAPYPLVGLDRRLNAAAVGWSRRPLCDATLPGPAGRRKRWNYWSFTTPDLKFVAAVVDADFMVVAFVHLLTFADRRWRETRLTLHPLVHRSLGGRVDDATEFRHRGNRIHFAPDATGVSVTVAIPRFDGGADLDAELRVETPPALESLNVTIPWSPTRYHFTSKQPARPARGTVRHGRDSFSLGGPDCFAALDFGRGVWRYNSAWNWASASGRDERGRVVGLNLGALWTDGTPMTENGVIVDGVAHKIDRAVRFDYDRRDQLRPWRIHSPGSNAVDLSMTPFHRNRLAVEAGVLSTRLDQVFGRLSGTVRLPEATVTLGGLVATCEEQRARW